MPVAKIQFVQPGGGGTGVVGQALIGSVALPVTVNNAVDPSVALSTFEVISVPTGSAIPLGIAQDGATPSWVFTPDLRGGYEIHLTTKDNVGNQADDYRVFQVAETSGRIIPPFSADDGSFNFGGQVLGWSPYVNAYLKAVDTGTGTTTPAALNIDWALSGLYTKTIAVNSVFTFSNVVDGQVIIVVITAGAGNTVTWPTVKWAAGTVPTQTSSGTDVYTFVKAGANIYGSVSQAMA